MKVVIVGGGFGGIKAALELAGVKDLEVQLISKRTSFEYHAALYRSATGRSPREVVIPLRKIFPPKSPVELVQDEIVSLDVSKQYAIGTDGDSYHYDILILALGQQMTDYGIPGVWEHAVLMDSIQHTIELRERLNALAADKTTHKLNFVVVGGGASGVELACELEHFVDAIARRARAPRKRVSVTLIEGGPRVLPLLKAKTSAQARRRLQELGVKVELKTKVTAITASQVAANDQKYQSDLTVWTAGWQGHEFFQNNARHFELIRNGRVKVNRYLQTADNIYVIGDSAATPYSGMAQTALHNAGFVAADIKRVLTNEPRRGYKSKRPVYVVPTGNATAVLESEHFRLHGRLAWIARRAADFRLFDEFEPLKDAVVTFRRGNQRARNY